MSGEQEQRERWLWAQYRAAPTTENAERILNHYQPVAAKLAKYSFTRNASPLVSYDERLAACQAGMARSIPKYRPTKGRSFAAFAGPAALGEIANAIRAAQPSGASLDTEPPAAQERPQRPFEGIGRRELRRRLRPHLSRPERMLVWLHFFRGIPIPRLAERWDMREHQVRYRLSRLLGHLRQQLRAADFSLN